MRLPIVQSNHSQNQKVANKKVLVVGLGGLGSPVTLALAEAGVRTIGIVDYDKVELSNLHRQMLYSSKDIGSSKVDAAKQKLKKQFPKLKIITFDEKANDQSLKKWITDYDLVIDGLDRLDKKYLLNDVCVRERIPFIHAGVVGWNGQVMGVIPGKTACLRCCLPEIPPASLMPSCQEAGVWGPFSVYISTIQSREALRLLNGETQFYLWKVDGFNLSRTRAFKMSANKKCPVCSMGKVKKIRISDNCEL